MKTTKEILGIFEPNKVYTIDNIMAQWDDFDWNTLDTLLKQEFIECKKVEGKEKMQWKLAERGKKAKQLCSLM